MVDEDGLRAALGRLLPAGAARFERFVVADGSGRVRMGTLCTDVGVYAEVSNFVVEGDYVAAMEGVVGVWRFVCEVDLFYSDIAQTMAMSRAAAERALASVG